MNSRLINQTFVLICRSINTMKISNIIHVFVIGLLMLCACSPKQAPAIAGTTDNQVIETNDARPEPQETVVDIPTDERLVTGVLANGMHYYIQQNARPENRAELRLAVNAGSLLEDEDQLGLAHFVEHMAFNGTKHFEKSELVDYLESVGTRFGADLNAYTSFDETVYMLQVRTDSTELFDQGMLILRDWANDVSFDDEEIDKERGVVESEWRSRLSAEQRMQQKYLPVIYHGSRYAERLPIGDPDIIKYADYDKVKRYYNDWYRPDLMAVVVVGDVDVNQVEEQIKSMFGDITEKPNKRKRETYDVPSHESTLVSVVSDEEAAFTQIQLMYKHKKKRTKTMDDYRHSLVRTLYNIMLGARLDELSKHADPPFIFAYSGYGSDVGDLDAYSSFAYAPEGGALRAMETLLTENRRILLHGFTASELDRGKKQLIERAENNFRERDNTESSRIASRYVYKYLQDIPTPGPKQILDIYNQFVPDIQLSEVNALGKQWITDENRVAIISGPEKESVALPTELDVLSVFQKSSESNPEPYVDDAVDEPFFNVSLDGNVEVLTKEYYEDPEITYMELANGVEVYYKKTDFKQDEIIMRATSPGGTSIYSDSEDFNASNAASLVVEAGIGAFSSTQLEKVLAGKSVRAFPFIGNYSEGVNGSASPDDLEVMMQLVYKYFTEPRFDEEVYHSFVSRQKSLYKNLMSNPQYFFSDYVSKTKYDNHPRVGWPNEEDWINLDYNKAMEYYVDRFKDASDFTFVFVGNFDEKVLEDYAKKYLGNLPSTGRSETWKDVGIRAIKGGLNARIQRGEAPKTNVHMYFHGDFDYSDQNNYVMRSAIDYLRIKLREELREDQGGVYGVGIFGGGSNKPYESYGVTISFNADPPETDGLIEAARGVIAKAMDDGPNEEDMVKIKEIQRQTRIKNLKENGFWQRQIMREHEEGRDFNAINIESFESLIDGLTADQIKNAVGQYFDYDNYIEIIMDPASNE